MKTKVYFPFLIIAAFILVVGMACSVDLFGKGNGSAPASAEQGSSSSEEQAASSSEEAASSSDEAASSSEEAPSGDAPDFYREEFDGDISNYTYFEYHELFRGAEADDSIAPTNKDGVLVFDLPKANKWVYITYDPYIYEDVTIELQAENRGKNNNNVSLLCRYSEDGWYEFNIANNGLYWIYAFIPGEGYLLVVNGGSTAIKQGRDINTYQATCSGDTLSLYINGVEVKTIRDTKYKLREGQVGFGVSSFDVTPILVEMEYFDISQP